MKDFDFSKWNKILGWAAFAIALVVFSLTVAPSVSFWDVGEYIATSTKLEVGHPPGAPLFQMIGAFFSIFATDDTQIALMVNMMSVFSSAFTILFMFWSISLLLRKIIGEPEKNSAPQNFAILASAFIGSVSFAFTDSFWFNAGEAEVYAMAAFFMSVLFYVGLLWERDMLKPRGNRWLILISFIVGLSFGVHFMALLTIPAIGYLYYFKKYKEITVKNFIIATLIVVGSLMFIFKLLLPYTLTFFAVSEVFFTNSLGLPFNTGTIIAFLAVIAFFVYALKHTRKKHYVTANTVLHCVLFILIGFSCWMMLPIRANAGTTINENDPSDARSLLAYYNREQYGETHLFYGPQFTSTFAEANQEDPYKDGKPHYERNEKTGEYEIVNEYENAVMNPDEAHKTLFPRMWDPSKADNYLNFTGPLEISVRPEYQQYPELTKAVADIQSQFENGKVSSEEYLAFLNKFAGYINVEKPTFWENLSFFWEFQVEYMYFRYFMWNFVGRQDDMQGYMDDLDGNWLSGIDFIDEMFLPPQDNLPSDVKNNPARNTYYFLPLILGIIGLIFHFNRDKKSFWVLAVFFLFTSLALAVYLNQTPFQPRERDYALVGSFYVFAMWMGFGVYAIFDWFREHVKPKIAAPVVMAVCLIVPGILIAENWNDHDRSGRYTALAMGKKYLDSVAENAILFTIGDNDTFLLWYLQEVEGYRTDVRVLNTQLLYTSWYIEQAKKQAYEGEPVETTLELEDYQVGTNDGVVYQEDPRLPDTMTVENWLQYVKSDHPSTQSEYVGGSTVNLFPAKNLRLPVNKQNVLDSGIVKPEDADKIVPYIDIKLPNVIYKNRLVMLDIVANTDWKRPVYFTGGSFTDADYLWMTDYLQLDGVCYKLVPIKTEHEGFFDMGRMEPETMYDIVMDWKWGNSGSEDIYHHPATRRNSITYRSNMGRLVEELLKQGDSARAKKVMDLAMEKMPLEHYKHYTLLEPFISGYYEIGETQRAREIWNKIAKKYQEQLEWFSTWDLRRQNRYFDEISTTLYKYRSLVDLLVINQDEEIVEEKIAEFNDYMEMFLPPGESPSLEEMLKNSGAKDSIDSIPGETREQIPNEPDGTSPVQEMPVDTGK
jgi:hypothetical protein